MNIELQRRTITHGAFIGLAISSRFLLNFQEGVWAEILSFVLLFSMYSALIMWIREYQKTLPENKISLKQVVSFSVKVFLIGAIISSIFKFIFFEYIKPNIFAMLVDQYGQLYNDFINKTNDFLLQAKKQKNANDILMYNTAIEQLKWLKSIVITPYFQPIASLILNVFGGLILGWFIWPIFKFNQQRPTPIK